MGKRVLLVWSHLRESVIKPRLSEGWGIAASLVGSLFVIKCGFRLTFFRTLLVSVIYWIVIGLAVYFILEPSLQIRIGTKPALTHNHAHAAAAAKSLREMSPRVD